MKLRKLIVQGFKSFGDKTEFVFDDGITCVVGPNGCGKSNVVDAIKWVLGEQSAKSLRGGEMMDVIFNGCSSRKPAALAEVTLEFDNASGAIQTDVPAASEKQAHVLSVSRRLYRSGESEYLINNQTARLKDIREMFLDTGIGGRSYSIIEQGRVAEMLQANPAERRVIFEEVAGISRYKARKKEAARKLENVEQNLLRVSDIIDEVGKRLRSIKYQAGKARNYQEYSGRLSELRSMHSLAQYHLLRSRRHELQQSLDKLTDQATSATARIAQLDSNHNGAESEMADMAERRRQAESEAAGISGRITAHEQRIEMLQARCVELEQQLRGSGDRVAEIRRRSEQARVRLEEGRRRLRDIELEINACFEQVEALLDDQKTLQVELSKLQGRLENEKARSLELIHKAGALRNRITGCDVRRQSLSQQAERLGARRDVVAAEIGELTASRGKLDGELTAAQAACGQLNSDINATREKAAEFSRLGRELDARIGAAKEKRSSLRSRRATLEEMARRGEGLAAGVRKVVEARRKGGLPFVRGLLADFVRAERSNAAIVETALAEMEQLLVVDSLAVLREGREQLDSVVGSAAVKVFCAETAASAPAAPAAPDGGIRLSDLVTVDERFAGALKSLFDRILVVDDLAAAEAMTAATVGTFSLVTRDGAFLSADGSVRLGRGASAGIISRSSEMEELAVAIEALDAEIDALAGRRDENSSACETVENDLAALRGDLDAANAALIDIRSRSRRLDEQIESMSRELPAIDGELASVARQTELNDAEQADAAEKLQAVEADSEQAAAAMAEIERAVAATGEKLAHVNRELTEMRVRHERALQQKSAANDSIASVTGSLAHMEREIRETDEQAAAARDRIAAAQESIATARTDIETLYADKERLDQTVADCDETLKGLNERIGEIRTTLQQQRDNAERLGDEAGKLKVSVGETDVRIEDLIGRVSDEMGLDLVETYDGYQHDEQRDWDAVAEEINTLREKIRRLGNVNLDAIDEQEQLEQRESFLAEQIADIRASRDQLVELIEKINATSRKLFDETFNAVRETFQVIFRKLFGGGRADIILTEAEDVLEAGVEIIARPPGKELRSISLLSGGEKTMTTVALVFSIFRTKPSPFCVLDEVDAALDEANNERFNMIVEEFLDQSQFIIITHSKRTMAISSVLYGVTMQEAGVSKRVSVKFEQAAEMVDDSASTAGGSYVSQGSAGDDASAPAEDAEAVNSGD